MPFAALDDQFHSNPKVMRAGFAAAGLYARALSYCGAFLTDGFVPAEWVRGICADHGARHLPKRLLTVELWETCEGGYRIPDYLDYNPSKEEVEKRREARAEAGRRGAMRRWGNVAETPPDSKGHSTSHSKRHSPPMAGATPRGHAPLPFKNQGLEKTRNGALTCPKCGIERRTARLLEEHLYNVHEEGAPA